MRIARIGRIGAIVRIGGLLAATLALLPLASAAPSLAPARKAASPLAEPPARVVQIYPTSADVPENLLKIYIEFSAPMRDGQASRRVRLLDAQGRALDGAFLEVDEELWDPTYRRLTLLLDPGRVKRGLRANLQSGAPLRAGRAVTLAIDGGWPDAAGRPLAESASRRWTVRRPDRSSPDPAGWLVHAPIAGTRAPLAVRFGEPLDRALLARMLRLEDAAGRVIPGEATVEPGESGWRFTPADAWTDAACTLVVDPRLEDLAANSIRHLFDADLTRAHVGHARSDGGAASPAAAVRIPIQPRRPT